MEPSAHLTSIDVIASALEPLTPAVSRLSSPDGALTLMLSDIADAGALAAAAGSGALGAAARDHHLLVERLRRRITTDRWSGSSATASSPPSTAPTAGLHAAVELQRTFAARDGDEASPALALRIGLHSGFVIADPDELLGRNVVLAARIAAHAEGGEILVSSTLKQYTESDPSFRVRAPRRASLQGAARRARGVQRRLAPRTLDCILVRAKVPVSVRAWDAMGHFSHSMGTGS